MAKTESENTNSNLMGLEGKKVKKSISEIKKELGLDQYTVIHKPIKVKKDGKHLYQVAGYFYPLRWETLERLKIPNQRILFEVDRDEWHKEMDAAREKQDETIDQELYPWGYEE
jgi:hypothetical protein